MNTDDDRPEILKEPSDFSLVLGGPLFQLFRKAHLSKEGSPVFIEIGN